MTVRKILAEKSIRSIETIAEDQTLAEAAAMLAEKKIGSLIVRNEADGVAGVLSERDVVRRLATDGADCLSTKVGAAMTTAVMTCEPKDTAISVLRRMTEGRFRHMPVMEDGRLTGVISIGDVVKARMSEIEHENRAMEDMIKGV